MAIKTQNWRFALAYSRSLNQIGEFTAYSGGVSLDVGLNKGGNLSLSYSHQDQIAESVSAVETCVLAIKNGEIVWSGPVWTIEDDLPSRQTRVTCVGWFEILMHQILAEDKYFPDNDAGYIAAALLANANSQASTGISMGTTEVTQKRTKNYLKYNTNIGQEIQQLAEIESGYDWYIDPATKVFSIFNEKMNDRTDAIFGYKWGPHNLRSVSRVIDSSVLVNKIYPQGNSITVGPIDDISSQARFGVFSEAPSLSDVTDTTILAAFGNAELAIRDYPRVTYNIVPTTNCELSIFEDYDIGDKIYFVCRDGRIDTGSSLQSLRVFGAAITIDQNGNESVTQLQTTAN